MYTNPSLTVVSREPASLPGMRSFSTVMKGVLAALAVVLLSFGTSAYAVDGPYVGVGGSLSLLNGSDVTAPAREGYPSLNANTANDTGFAVRGMAGYAFPSGFRVEGEIDYRRHGIDEMDVKSPGALVKLAVDGAIARGLLPAGTEYAQLPSAQQARFNDAAKGTQSIDGNFSMLAFMANVDYDFDMGSPWVPYIGGGLGVATISVDAESAAGTSLVDDSDTVFAYQVGAGIGYEFPLEEGRSITVSLDWRYFGTQAPTFKGDVSGEDFEATINGHDIGIGLIYGF
ncbi:MAG: outer membrane beta-barrel protein [Nitrospira sp.]|nr:outer membrane beta-barrel protein [Nitrospira sp.]MCY4131258.1 outer membrane beta-barrel protein [Nitrospira sp.]